MKIDLLGMVNSMNKFNNNGMQNFLPTKKSGWSKGIHSIPKKWLQMEEDLEETEESYVQEDAEEENQEEKPAASCVAVPQGGEKAVLPAKAGSGAYLSKEENLQKAVVWAEILGEPVSKRRRRKRWEQHYGDQGYAGRR